MRAFPGHGFARRTARSWSLRVFSRASKIEQRSLVTCSRSHARVDEAGLSLQVGDASSDARYSLQKFQEHLPAHARSSSRIQLFDGARSYLAWLVPRIFETPAQASYPQMRPWGVVVQGPVTSFPSLLFLAHRVVLQSQHHQFPYDFTIVIRSRRTPRWSHDCAF